MARTRETITTDAPSAPMNDKRKRKRLTIYLQADGTPDWEGVTDEQRTQLGVIAQPAGTEPEAPPMSIPPEVIGYFVMTLTRIESAIIAPRMGLDAAETMRVLTPAPPVLEGISEAGAKVLAKYGGTMGKYQDEIVLGMLLIQWQAGAIGTLRGMKAELEDKREPAPPSTEQRGSVEGKPKPNFGAMMAERKRRAAESQPIQLVTPEPISADEGVSFTE